MMLALTKTATTTATTAAWLLGLALLSAPALAADPTPAPGPTPDTSEPAFPKGTDAILPGLVDVGATLPVRVELKYATTDNFMGRDVYGGLTRCFLVDDATRMLGVALTELQRGHPGWSFVMYDCARPRKVQLVMWDIVKGTPQQGYVANPHTPPGSIHNTGCAVDLSVWDTAAKAAVDMGTPYDFFGAKAHPAKEVELWKKGQLTGLQWANRLALREAMLRAGFRPLGHEWWHFDCADGGTARKRYPVIP
jgi:D-alanyl-D-alanine dipeptidase